jgi:hypothetical protein
MKDDDEALKKLVELIRRNASSSLTLAFQETVEVGIRALAQGLVRKLEYPEPLMHTSSFSLEFSWHTRPAGLFNTITPLSTYMTGLKNPCIDFWE